MRVDSMRACACADHGLLTHSHIHRLHSGAKYEGQWRGNQKHGRGVYMWPQGGAYAGEWRGGRRCGLGARTWKDGSKAPACGRWEADVLVEPMSAREVDAAVEGALQAASAARDTGMSEHLHWTAWVNPFFDPASVHLFAAAAAAPGSLRGVLAATAIAPAFLALCASLLVWAADVVIPPSAASFVAHLANAHRPLTLLSLGAALADGGARIVDGRGSEALTRSMAARLIRLPPPPQLRAALATLVLKYVTSLVLAAGIAAAVALAASTGDVYGWSASGLACAVACALVAPVSPMAVYYAEQQRNAAASAAPLVASVSLGVSAVCWAVIGGLHASGVAATSPWVAPAASLALAAACYLAASMAAAALAPTRMRTTKAAFQAATGRGGTPQAALGRMTHTRYDRRRQHNTTQITRVVAPAMPGRRLRCVLAALRKPPGRANAAAPPHPRTRQGTVHGSVRVTLLSLMA